jgi:hypothetical protein
MTRRAAAVLLTLLVLTGAAAEDVIPANRKWVTPCVRFDNLEDYRITNSF